jgi:Predicted transcriptional regulator
MALADLAKFDPNEPVSLRDISLRQGISLVYLEQLFLKLKKNKIVNSVRGNKGGYTLNRHASEIKIWRCIFSSRRKNKNKRLEKHSKKGCNEKVQNVYSY